MTMRKPLFGVTLVLLACAASCALAQDRDRDRGGPPAGKARPEAGPGGRQAAPGWHGGPGRGRVEFDGRYGHNHYYPSRGFVYYTLPVGALSVAFAGGNYFYQGGVWFRPYGGHYVVVQPPIGIFVPVLPPDYATVWVGGNPYYYADGVYYSVLPGRGYVVVAPPPDVVTIQTPPPPPPPRPAAPDPIYYPRNNQSPAQMEADRRDCNTWATSQPSAMADARVFQRATDACMDGRGYTVR